MTEARGFPWLASLALHAALAAAALALVRFPDPPAPVRMHLSVSGGPQVSRVPVSVPRAPAQAPSEPGLPSWKSRAADEGRPAPAVPVSLDELLGGSEPAPAAAASGWDSEGYAPPPLPPPGLAPPQGARWSLVVSVPAGGGPGAVEGLDSGHPELDRWLEAYLRTVSFPPGLDGAYQLRWNLTLVSERPQ